MNTKLTLTIDQSVIERAKKYARKKERSLSDLIENYLKALTTEEFSKQGELSPKVKSLNSECKASKTASLLVVITSTIFNNIFRFSITFSCFAVFLSR